MIVNPEGGENVKKILGKILALLGIYQDSDQIIPLAQVLLINHRSKFKNQENEFVFELVSLVFEFTVRFEFVYHN